MFNVEELEVLEEMDLISMSVEDCIRRLEGNIQDLNDEFARDFLRNLISKIEELTDQEYAKQMAKEF